MLRCLFGTPSEIYPTKLISYKKMSSFKQGFGVWGLGFGVWGLGFGVWGLLGIDHVAGIV